MSTPTSINDPCAVTSSDGAITFCDLINEYDANVPSSLLTISNRSFSSVSTARLKAIRLGVFSKWPDNRDIFDAY